MLVELHLLQNFAPSNLNRDDTGSPKDCEFGGYRRARISSQCLKRAIRTAFKDEALLPKEHSAQMAYRTKRITDELVKRLGAQGKPEAEARPVVEKLLRGIGLGFDEKDKDKTQYPLFLGEREIAGVVILCLRHWDTLQQDARPPDAVKAPAPLGRRSSREAKKEGKAAVPPEVSNALRRLLDGGKAVDLALFGRMLADLPDRNIDAACQVAHALSTNKVSVEFDYYTAVDDLKPEETAGANMIGTVEFNSACYYRYANVNLGQLRENLHGDAELAEKTLEAFIRASVEAIPTGKQNSMAAQNPPSLVFAVVRDAGLWSLANAFARPVWPGGTGDLVQLSVGRLDEYWGRLTRVYGKQVIRGKWVALLEDDGLHHLAGARVDSVEELIAKILETVRAGDTGVGMAG